jgi:hypothetical protein
MPSNENVSLTTESSDYKCIIISPQKMSDEISVILSENFSIPDTEYFKKNGVIESEIVNTANQSSCIQLIKRSDMKKICSQVDLKQLQGLKLPNIFVSRNNLLLFMPCKIYISFQTVSGMCKVFLF